jgi:RNA polymerase sigma-70 factor (ECF subfamily)
LDPDRQARIEAALDRAVSGENEAFAQLVREHQAMVFSVAWHYLSDRSLAEDVAQEVFLELHQNLGRIESAAHLVHWLRRVAVHRSIDQGRRKKFRQEVAMEEVHEPAVGGLPRDEFLSERLRRLVARLPDRQRMMVVLRYQEELGPAEIAELLQLPVNTVKSTLHRALEGLRGQLVRKIKEARYAFF